MEKGGNDELRMGSLMIVTLWSGFFGKEPVNQ
jgi:hypothetical protein